LHSGGDKDWYSFNSSTSTGEIIHVELCPIGSSCYNETTKHGWIMYVFDATKLKALNATTGTTGEDAIFPLNLLRDDTNAVVSTVYSNQMYLNYLEGGAFTSSDPDTDALIGIVDPCFDSTNTVDIGVPVFTAADSALGYKEYLIAISSSLEGEPRGVCGAVTVVLEEPGPSFKEADPDDPTKLVEITTTQEYTSVFPRTDDQYTIAISRTSINPLASANKDTLYVIDI